jgi:hypothetical protein
MLCVIHGFDEPDYLALQVNEPIDVTVDFRLQVDYLCHSIGHR